MRVLVACEFSGVVRDAFLAQGHDAISCDLLPTRHPGPHIQGNVLDVLADGWDLMIAHPPCTYLSYVANRWLKSDPQRMQKVYESAEFVKLLWSAPIPSIAIENPRGWLSKLFKQSDQVIQPWYFGDPMTKETHLWLKNLPPLLYTLICADKFSNWTEFGHRSSRQRSITFNGIADAMANQWSNRVRE